MAVIESDEDSAHEAHVAMEVIRRTFTGVEVRAGARERQFGLGDCSFEVGDDRGVVTGIWEIQVGGRRPLGRGREEKVARARKVWDWAGAGGAFGTGVLVLPRARDRGNGHQPRPGTRCASEEPSASQTL